MSVNEAKNYILNSYSAWCKSSIVKGMPIVLTIEPTNICNLKCPVCETGAGILRREKGCMSLADFNKVLDNAGTQVNQLLFYFMGEPLLNTDAYSMIAEARRRGIYVSVCTNGEFVDGHRLVETGVNEVSFQIGGISQQTHSTYRAGGHLNTAVENIRESVQSRDYDHHHVKLTAGFIVMKHNEHEISHFIEWAIRLGVIPELINPCVRTIEQGKQFMPDSPKYWFYDRDAFDRGILKPKVVPHNRCTWIYYSTVVCWNGDVVPCCRDAQGDYVMGNILKQDFKDIWNGGKYQEFRKRIATEQSIVKLCRLCSGYGIPRI